MILRAAATAVFVGLLVLQPAWHLLWHPPTRFEPLWITAIAVLPLMPLVPGIVADQPKAWMWACFAGLIYFVHGVVEAWSGGATRVAGLLEVSLALALFLLASLHVRRRARPRPSR